MDAADRMRLGFVVASCGVKRFMASKSPVSATTVVSFFRESREVILEDRLRFFLVDEEELLLSGSGGLRKSEKRKINEEIPKWGFPVPKILGKWS